MEDVDGKNSLRYLFIAFYRCDVLCEKLLCEQYEISINSIISISNAFLTFLEIIDE